MNLQEELCEWFNIRLAYQNASQGKRGREATAAFEMEFPDNLIEIQNELLDKSYQPSAYTSFYVQIDLRVLKELGGLVLFTINLLALIPLP